MRRYLALALGVAVALSAAGIAVAAPNATSTVKVKFTPSKLPKKKFKSGSLFVETSTVYPNGGGTPTHPTKRPEPTKKVALDFDDDFKFNSGSVPQCKVSDAAFENFTGTITQATQMCGAKSVVGSGNATVCLAGATGNDCGGVNQPEQADVIAFNGQPKKNKPTIYLYAKGKGDIATIGQELTGTLSKSPLGGDFGRRLTVPVPPLGGGIGAITDFKTTVQNGRFVQARCHDGNHKLNLKGTFTYTDDTVDHVGASQKCTIKR